jgi:hypothetical protein
MKLQNDLINKESFGMFDKDEVGYLLTDTPVFL